MSRVILGQGLHAKIIEATIASGASSDALFGVKDIRSSRTVGLTLHTTGTVAGAWHLYVSNFHVVHPLEEGQPAQDGPWSEITGSGDGEVAIATPAGSATNYAVRLPDMGFRFLKAQFVPTGGTGTASAYIGGGSS